MKTKSFFQNRLEEYVISLDFCEIEKGVNIYFAVGVNYFQYFKIFLKKGLITEPFEKLYVGKGFREKIHHLKIIEYSEMPLNSQKNIVNAFRFCKIEDILKGLVKIKYKIIDEFEKDKKHVLLLDTRFSNDIRDTIESRLKELTGKEYELRSQFGMLMNTRILRGKNYQH